MEENKELLELLQKIEKSNRQQDEAHHRVKVHQ